MTKKTLAQMDFFLDSSDEKEEKIKKMQNSIKGLFRRLDMLKKDIQFQEDELEDFIKDSLE